MLDGRVLIALNVNPESTANMEHVRITRLSANVLVNTMDLLVINLHVEKDAIPKM